MKHLLNTLYITTQNSYLHKENETIVIRVENEIKLRVPVHTLCGIICFGNVLISPHLMGFCMEKQIAVSFLSMNGYYLGKVIGRVHGNVLLRREQYRKADDEEQCCKIARNIIIGKIVNARAVLMRTIRDNPELKVLNTVSPTIKNLSHMIKYLKNETSVDNLRGKEGFAANCYFEVFDQCIIAQKEEFCFEGRSRRPPLDPVNALLSFVYTLLVHDVTSALETVGLDPCVGFLHKDRPGRPSLALDMMEELRPYIADRLVLSLINRLQVKSNGFTTTETGAVIMDEKTRKIVITAYQERKQDEITHPFLKEKIQVGLIPYVQAMLLAKYIRNDIDGYPPFIWR